MGCCRSVEPPARHNPVDHWFIVLPILGAAVDFYLLTQLSPIAITIGCCCWLGLGVLSLFFLTKGFRKEPPEMRLHARDGQPDEPTKEV